MSKVIGLLEVVNDEGGECETVELANDLRLDAESLLPVTDAAELLGFITISGGRMTLTPAGKKAITGTILQRRESVKQRLMTLPTIKKVLDLIQAKKNKRLPKRALARVLSAEMPRSQVESNIKRLINWGRHSGLIGFNADTDELFIIS